MDRKARIREYKETRRPAGVYRILNTTSGRFLLGSNSNLPAILNRQRFQLESGLHPNRALQRDWNALGADSFTFEILDYLELPDDPGYDPAGDLCTLQEMWLEKLSASVELRYAGE